LGRYRVREISEIGEVDPSLLGTVHALLPQLSSSPPPFFPEHLAEIVSSPASRLLVAEDEAGEVHGMLTLALFRVPTGVRAWIEDVVVDERARGQRLGGRLVEAALRLAGEAGARTVDLTSRPSRIAAHELYLRSGFEVRDTTVYRYDLQAKQPPAGEGG
jgi:GNAT superfamily N-acetyltransferase